jgi:hypothetical protein
MPGAFESDAGDTIQVVNVDTVIDTETTVGRETQVHVVEDLTLGVLNDRETQGALPVKGIFPG